METGTTRREEDLLGVLEIPAEVYWGVHTGRAIRNFPLSGRPVRPALIRALALVKKACAAANLELDYLPPQKADAIIAAAAEHPAVPGGKTGEEADRRGVFRLPSHRTGIPKRWTRHRREIGST